MPYVDRRTFVAGGLTLFGSLASRIALGQPFPPNAQRAAVVIGLDHTPGLQGLRAAVSGAEKVATFFDGEGFEVFLFTDKPEAENDRPKLVRGYQIADQIEELVRRGTVEQLVVYFAGHGTLSGRSEYWLLSKAATLPAEAVSLLDTMLLARLSGIPNVVLISDACRSVASSLNLSLVTGQPVFPSSSGSDTLVDVDIFLAARQGDPALEMQASQSVEQYEGIFTSAFLKAFREPDRDMIHSFENGVNVIPNRKLRGYLIREVSRRAQERSVRLNQLPDAMVMSSIPTYIARSSVSPEDGGNEPTIDIAEASVSNALVDLVQDAAAPEDPANFEAFALAHPGGSLWNDARALVVDNALRQVEDLILPETGLAVYGGRIAEVMAFSGPNNVPVGAERIIDDGSREGWRVPFSDAQAISALVTFQDGSGCVVALLQDFGLHMTLDESGISDMRYNPSEESFLFDEFLDAVGYEAGSPGGLALLRGLANEAKRQGVLRFEGSIDERSGAAERFAGRIRMGKGLDPTLGIYSAYAYALAFVDSGTRSVHEILRGDLGASLFDTALLAGTLIDECEENWASIVPAAPMLRQGWEFLRARKVTLSMAFTEARPFLRDSLWSTFEPEGMDILKAQAEEVLLGKPC